MHSTNSFIYTVIERIRGYLDDPDLDAKYTDDFLIRHIIMPSMTNVMARINNSLTNPVVSKLLISTVKEATGVLMALTGLSRVIFFRYVPFLLMHKISISFTPTQVTCFFTTVQELLTRI